MARVYCLETVDSFASGPPGFSIQPLGAASTIQVDVEGSRATLNSATFYIAGSTPLGSLGDRYRRRRHL